MLNEGRHFRFLLFGCSDGFVHETILLAWLLLLGFFSISLCLGLHKAVDFSALCLLSYNI